jgi:hypothetical protein
MRGSVCRGERRERGGATPAKRENNQLGFSPEQHFTEGFELT